MPREEGPSPEDLARFGDAAERETGFCPDCGAEIWDQADVCPKCFTYLGGRVASKPPFNQWLKDRWKTFVVIAVILAMVAVFVL